MKHLKTFENYNNPVTTRLEDYTQPLLVCGKPGSGKLSISENSIKEIGLDYQIIDCSKLTKDPSSLITDEDSIIFDNIDKANRNIIPFILRYVFVTAKETIYAIFTCSNTKGLPKILTDKSTIINIK